MYYASKLSSNIIWYHTTSKIDIKYCGDQVGLLFIAFLPTQKDIKSWHDVYMISCKL